MKKFLSMVLVLVMCLVMCACGSSQSDPTVQPPKSVENVDQTESTAPMETPTESTAPTETPTKSTQVTIEEVVLVEESGVKITAKSLELDGSRGPELKLLIENNSGVDLTVQCRNSSINGYMIDANMSEDVVNGKKANTSLKFASSDLEQCNITTLADMEFSFHIFTTEGWDTYLDTDMIAIKTSAADEYVYEFDDSGDVAWEQDGIKLVIKGLVQEERDQSARVLVYIENATEKTLTVQVRDVSVNGFMIDSVFSPDVSAGKHALSYIKFSSSDLEENEITDVSSIELSFHIFSQDDWSDSIDTETISINFE